MCRGMWRVAGTGRMGNGIYNRGVESANPDVFGFTDAAGNHNLIDEPAELGALGYHDGGTTETMLPSAMSQAVVGGPGLNPDGLTTDQDGVAFGTVIFIGAVQTTR